MKLKNNDIESIKGINLQAIFKGTLYSFYLAIALVVIFGLIIYYSNLSENWLGFSTSTIFVIVTFIGGLISAKKAGYKGVYHGCGVGLLFTLIALVVTMLFIPGGFSTFVFLKKLVYGVIAGSLGGIAGVAFN